MDFPPEWTVLTTDEYETATPRITGDVTMEICAQLRPSGRILENGGKNPPKVQHKQENVI
jgi:hypothetical protein